MFSVLAKSALARCPKTCDGIMHQVSRTFAVKNGTVKWFDTTKGYGFISPEDGSPDVFVHQTAVHADGFRSLAEGEAVEFTTMTDDRGKVKAERVTGPTGAFVQGAPRQQSQYSNEGRSGRFGGGGGGGGGGYGGGGGFGSSGGGFGMPDQY